MNIYKIKVKDWEESREDNPFTDFIVIGETISDMLENLYKELSPEHHIIPYYLRSSNFIITLLGEFTPDEKNKNLKVLSACTTNYW